MTQRNHEYIPANIEKKWQEYWVENKTFSAKDDTSLPKYFVLDMFPYPSGAGLHLGHPANYTPTDVLARFKKARGYNVLHPTGWDAFGLPTEQYAIKTGTHPAITSETNINRFREQLKQLGYVYDWDREVNTTDPNYFRWTQWIFLQLFKHGLAYVDEKPVWWCPELGTVLANEEVIDGKSERGNFPVERRNLRQWVLRITKYADKLLDGLENIDWPESSKKLQRNWIGKSKGAEIDFAIDGTDEKMTVFTTRPDTLMGVTYVVLAPEHALVAQITTEAQSSAVAAYCEAAKSKSDLERAELAKDKTGVFSGAYAIHPITGEQVPVWVADYVLVSYGTGCVMAVPGHDERDFEFAKALDLPIKAVIKPSGQEGDDVELPFTAMGELINSGEFTGLSSRDAKVKIVSHLESSNKGSLTVNFKLRDWLFSRQRYWGEPFPIVWVSKEDYQLAAESSDSAWYGKLPTEPVTYENEGSVYYALPLPESALPLTLPEVDSYEPSGSGESPLAKATDWLAVTLDLHTGALVAGDASSQTISGMRETNTMPQWAGSCWYYLRYRDPANADELTSEAAADYWGVPDFYLGGAEHVNLHLLYARFWHLFLHDIGVVKDPEPFPKLFHQGLILAEDGEKMSKSRGNVVNPETIIDQYGADVLRVYQSFLGPVEASKPWSVKGIEGISRFLRKLWREMVAESGELSAKIIDAEKELPETEKLLHATIQKVTDDYENIRLNTIVSQLMILVNQFAKAETVTRKTIQATIQMLAPLAPHITEELWQLVGDGESSVASSGWPSFDPSKLVSDEVKLMIQINGKLRGDLLVSKDTAKEDIFAMAKEHERVIPFLEGKTIRKEIYVPGKIVNLVVG